MAIEDIYGDKNSADVFKDVLGGEKGFYMAGISSEAEELDSADIFMGKNNDNNWLEERLKSDAASLPVVHGFDGVRADLERFPDYNTARIKDIFRRLEEGGNSIDFATKKRSVNMISQLNMIEDKYRDRLAKYARRHHVSVAELASMSPLKKSGWGTVDITKGRDKIYKNMIDDLNQWGNPELLDLAKNDNDRLLLETGNMVRDKKSKATDFLLLAKKWQKTQKDLLSSLPKKIVIPNGVDDKNRAILDEQQKELRDKRDNIIKYTQEMSNFMHEMKKLKRNQPKKLGHGEEAIRALKRIYYSKYPNAVGGLMGIFSGGSAGADYRTGGSAMAMEPDLIESGKASEFMSSNWWTKNVVEGSESIAESVAGAYLASVLFGGGAGGAGVLGMSGETVGFLGFALPMGLEVAGNKFSDTYEKLLKDGKSKKNAWATATVEGLLSASVEVATERIGWGTWGEKMNKALHGGWGTSLERGVRLSFKDKVRAYIASGASATFAEFMEENISSVGNDLIDALHGDSRIVKMVKNNKITWEDVEQASKEVVGNFAGVLSSFGLGAGGTALGIHNAEGIIKEFDKIKSEVAKTSTSVDDVVGTVLTNGEKTVKVVDVSESTLMVEDAETGDMGELVDNGNGELVMNGDDKPWKLVPVTSEEVEPTVSEEVEPTVSEEVEPTASEEVEPTASEEVEPTASEEVEPTASEEVEPTVSEEIEPTASEEVEPTVSEEVEPTVSEEGEPTASEEVEPTASEEVEPTASEEVEPTVSEEIEPTVSEEVEPTVSEEVEPTVSEEVEPTVSEEVEPTVSEEGEPTVSEEVESTASEEVEPTTGDDKKFSFTLDTPDDKYNVSGKWQVFDVDDVLVSSDEGFPQELQPRNRDSVQSNAQILSIAKNVKWQKLFESAGITSSGAPLVLRVKDGEFGNDSGKDKFVVVVGNGRWSGIRMGYKSGTGADDYKKNVVKHANSVGLDVNTNNPVLARVIDIDKLFKRVDNKLSPVGFESMADFAVSSNKDEKLDMSNVEQSIVDAKIMLDNKLLSAYRVDSNGNVLARSNDPFLQQFVNLVGASGVLVARQGTGGVEQVWSKELAGRVERAVLAALFSSLQDKQQLLDALIEGTDFYGIGRVVSAVNKVAGKLLQLADVKPQYNIIPDIALAMQRFITYKKDIKGGIFRNIDDFVAQGDLFADGQKRTRASEAILLRLGSAKRISDIVNFFTEYLESVKKIDVTTKDMFGVENDSKETIIERILKNEQEKEAGGLSSTTKDVRSTGLFTETREDIEKRGRESKDGSGHTLGGGRKAESKKKSGMAGLDEAEEGTESRTGSARADTERSFDEEQLGSGTQDSEMGGSGSVSLEDDVSGVYGEATGEGGLLDEGEESTGTDGSGFSSGSGLPISSRGVGGTQDNNQVSTSNTGSGSTVDVSRDANKDGSSKSSRQGADVVEATAERTEEDATAESAGLDASDGGSLSSSQLEAESNRASKEIVAESKEINNAEDLEVKSPSLTLKEKLKAQREAEKIPVKVGDRGNITKTLPFLYKEQQDDVYKAEQRMLVDSPTPDDPKKGMLFANGTGTGKTFTGLGVMKRFIKRGKGRILVLVPTQAKVSDWIKEAKLLGIDITKILNGKDAGDGVVVTTYANMRDNKILQNASFDLVVADESHYLNSNAAGNKTSNLRGFDKVVGKGDYQKLKLLQNYSKEIEKNIIKKGYDLDSWFDKDGRLYRDASSLLSEKSKTKYEKELQNLEPTRVVLLSATPFAYVKNIAYANHLLFYAPDKNKFIIDNFGYRVRHGKLTIPDAEVDTGLLERDFSDRLQSGGAMSVRMLSVDKDYSRQFIDVESELGAKIQRGLDLINHDSYPAIASNLHRLHTYHYRVLLLEALKTKSALVRVEKHLNLGRKVVVFHSRKTGTPSHPFNFEPLIGMSLENDSLGEELRKEINDFHTKYPMYRQLDLSSLQNSIAKFGKKFGKKVVMFNGDIPAKQRNKNIKLFNDDHSGVDVILVQMDAGKEGISLHDVTGTGKQRVLMALNLPNKPVDISQMEGRIYRLGVKSNAVIEYLKTGLNMEKWAFGSSINTKSSTAENLALGTAGRDLKTIIKDQYIDSSSDAPSSFQGAGGKIADRTTNVMSVFKKAITYFYKREKKNKKTSGYGGVDFFATPEPLGLKMVEWLHLVGGDNVLEPSAGDGAIARWFPENVRGVMLEPSDKLAGDLMVRVGGSVYPIKFEQYDIHNKFDGIAMNPPFGKQSKLAFEHVAKGFIHLKNGGRIVALVPSGRSFDKRFVPWLESKKNAYLRTVIDLPAGIFSRVGTGVKTKILIIDRVDNDITVPPTSKIDIMQNVAKPSIKEFFDKIEDMSVVDRMDVPTPTKTFKKFGVNFSLKKEGDKVIVVLAGKDFIKAAGKTFFRFLGDSGDKNEAWTAHTNQSQDRGKNSIVVSMGLVAPNKVYFGSHLEKNKVIRVSELEESFAEYIDRFSHFGWGRGLSNLKDEIEEGKNNIHSLVVPQAELGGESFVSPSKDILPKKKTKKKTAKSDIIKFINDNFMVVRKGRSGRFKTNKSGGALGFYSSSENEIRLKNSEDIEVVMHEFGHALHGALFGKQKGYNDKIKGLVGLSGVLSNVALQELEALGKATTPLKKQADKKYLQKEGVAEYVRRYIFAPDTVTTYAPVFTKAFTMLLAENPDVYKVVSTLQNMVAEYQSLSEFERVQSKIKNKKEKKPTIKNFSRKMKKIIARIDEEMYDALSPLRRAFDKVIAAKPALKNEVEKIWLEAWMLRGEAGRVSAFLSHQVFDSGLRRLNVKPFAQILSDAVKNNVLAEFEVYLVVNRSLELIERNIKTGLEDISLEEIKNKLQEKHPVLKKLAKDLKKYQNALLMYYAESGMMKLADAKAMISENLSYVPFYRWFDSDLKEENINNSFLQVSGSYVNIPSAIKRQFGSTRSIISPLSGIVMNTVKMISKADENRVGQLFSDLANDDETAWLIKKLDKQFNMKPITVSVGELLRDFEGQGIGLVHAGTMERLNEGIISKESNISGDGDNLEPLDYSGEQFESREVTIYRPVDLRALPDESFIRVWRDGLPVVYQVDPDVAGALRGISMGKAHWFINLISLPVKTLRIGATTAPSFVVNNIGKDQTAVFVNSKYGYNPLIDFIKGVYSFVKKDDSYIDFLKGGGANAMFVSQDIDRSKRDIEELVAFGAKGYRGVLRRGRWVLSHPIASARKFGEMSEVGTRLGNFKKSFMALQKQLAQKGNTKNPILDWVYNFLGIFPGIMNNSNDWQKSDTRLLEKIKEYNLEEEYNNMVYVVERMRDISPEEKESIKKDTAIHLVDMAMRVDWRNILLKSALSARDDSSDFGRWGRSGKIGSRIWAFMNPNLQEQSKIWRMLKDPKTRYGYIARALVAITIPTLLESLLYRDDPEYQDIDKLSKDILYHVKIGDRFIPVFPKAWGLNTIFGNIPRDIMNGILDAMDPEQEQHLVSDLISSFNHGFAMQFVPTLAIPWIENKANKSLFTGGTIVPLSAQGLEAKDQYKDSSSLTTKVIGNVVPGEGASPAKIDNYVTSWFAGLGKYGLLAVDKALSMFIEDPSGNDYRPIKYDIPIIRRYLPNYSRSRSISKLYDIYKDTKTQLASYAIAKQAGDTKRMKEITQTDNWKINTYYSNKKRKFLFNYYDSMSRIARLRRDIRSLRKNKEMTDFQKTEIADAKLKQIRSIAREVIKDYNKKRIDILKKI